MQPTGDDKLARSRKVDSELALQTARSIFTECGFTRVGTRELEARSGITRFTLQTIYGGKKALYLLALDSYLDDFEHWLIKALGSGGIDSLAAFYRGRADDAVMGENGKHGCFMLTTIIEFGEEDEEINIRASRYFEMFRDQFRAALTNELSADGLHVDVDIDDTVNMLLAGILGLNSYVRAHRSNTACAPLANALACHIEQLAK